jgi:ATP-binding cassette subfamily B protein
MRFARLLPYLKRHRRALVVGVVAIVLGDLLLLFAPWLLRRSIDALQADDLSGAKQAALLMLAVTAAGGVFKFIMRRWMIGASRWIELELRHDFTAHAFRLSPSYYDTHKVGDLMALATNDLNAIRMLLGPGIMYLINTSVTVTVALILMSSMSWQLTLLAFLPLPILALAVHRGSRAIYRRFSRVQEQFAAVTSFAQESLSGIRVVKAYARENGMAERFGDSSREYMRRNISFFRVQAAMFPMMTMLAGFAAAITLFFGGRMVIVGAISVGTLVAFLAYVSQLTWPTIALGWTINLWQRGLASLDRMGEVFDAVPEVQEHSDARPWPREDRHGHVKLRDVTFTYPEAKRASVLNVTCELTPGSWTALVGPTGAGKTTLVRLLSRQYDGYLGSIEIDGRDLRELRLADLRAGTGYAPQDGYLFSDTLRENIGFGAPRLDEDHLDSLARISRLERDRSHFPEGWETQVGERGVTLSGGQKQRVGVARALAHDPVLLLLDDVFSSVDTETEAELLAQLRQAWSGRTVLLVTHRLLAVQEADQILVMDEGRLTETGTHEELLESGGVYAQLFRRQMAEAEIDALGEAS